MKLRADLHIHTNYSDGLLTPEEVVTVAKKNGVQLIAITDHDCTFAYKEVANADGIKVVCGTEISAYLNGVKIHILGYKFNPDSPVFSQFFKELYEGSLKRTEDILFKLNKAGVKLTIDEVLKYRTHSNTHIHSSYIARAAAEKGWCGGNSHRFYAEYLATGKCGHSEIGRATPQKAVEVINASGGFCSLAHPARIEMGEGEILSLVKYLKDAGLGGIEAVYSTHTVIQTAYYKELAKTLNLLVTGGSDTHTLGGSREIGKPEFFVSGVLAEKLGI